MRCMNCGLPLSPTRTPKNCPRCGAAVNTVEGVEQLPFGQAGWGGTPPQHNSWGQQVANQPWQQNQFGAMPGQFSETPASMRSTGQPQAPFAPRRPTPKKRGAGIKIALVGLITATLLLAVIAVLGFTHLGKASPNTPNPVVNTSNGTQAATSPTTASASPTVAASASPTATGTPYPGQQFIDGAQMVSDPTTAQPASSFTVGSKMYVAFNLHPPSQGGEVCAYWYLNGAQITNTPLAVPATRHSSYAFAIYGSAGPAYVELYWASDATCADKMLAQHVDFTVTT